MNCPVCGKTTTVKRFIKESNQMLRLRGCLDCGHLFYTVETETKEAKFSFRLAEAERSRKHRALRKSKGVENNDEGTAP